jgi:DNA-directed RNA polymerase subunit RPC12/RpoP
VKTLRGELRCFACSRYLGEFESHPDAHGVSDFHLRRPEVVSLPHTAIETERGLRCSHCGGRVVAEHIDRIAA